MHPARNSYLEQNMEISIQVIGMSFCTHIRHTITLMNLSSHTSHAGDNKYQRRPRSSSPWKKNGEEAMGFG
jgi:hypothetical protein